MVHINYSNGLAGDMSTVHVRVETNQSSIEFLMTFFNNFVTTKKWSATWREIDGKNDNFVPEFEKRHGKRRRLHTKCVMTQAQCFNFNMQRRLHEEKPRKIYAFLSVCMSERNRRNSYKVSASLFLENWWHGLRLIGCKRLLPQKQMFFVWIARRLPRVSSCSAKAEVRWFRFVTNNRRRVGTNMRCTILEKNHHQSYQLEYPTSS